MEFFPEYSSLCLLYFCGGFSFEFSETILSILIGGLTLDRVPRPRRIFHFPRVNLLFEFDGRTSARGFGFLSTERRFDA